MAGNPADERFRPPDPPLGTGNPIVQSKIHEVAEESLSTSSQATVEAEIDASRHNLGKGNNISSQGDAIRRIEEQMEIEKIASQQSMQVAAKSIQNPGHSVGNRQESNIGDISPVRDSNIQQIGVGIEGQNVDHRHEEETSIVQ